MTTLILKMLNNNGHLNKKAIIAKAIEIGIVPSEEFTEKVLQSLEEKHAIKKLKNGEYILNGRMQIPDRGRSTENH